MRPFVVLLLALSVLGPVVGAPDPVGAATVPSALTGRAVVAPATWPGPRVCDGVPKAKVRGARPRYASGRLALFDNHRAQCRALWLPLAQRWIVPQSMALDGDTAWVVGYRLATGSSAHPCRILRMSLRTGRLIAYQRLLVGRVGTRPAQYCRHGGGIALERNRLWIVEKGKLWMIRRDRAGHTLRANRVWRIDSPVRGSTVVTTRGRIGLVPFRKSGKPRIYWYRFHDIVARQVRDLGPRGNHANQVGPVATTRVPTFVQGAMLGPTGRLYLTRSSARCGEIVRANGRRIAFVPGAEQLQLAPKLGRLWVVSESGARAFQRSGRPLTPAVSSFEWPRVLHGPRTRCHF